ncbi:MAG: hypothetical protein AB1758_20730 [Candidatus Eremiobacterota bacterium]
MSEASVEAAAAGLLRPVPEEEDQPGPTFVLLEPRPRTPKKAPPDEEAAVLGRLTSHLESASGDVWAGLPGKLEALQEALSWLGEYPDSPGVQAWLIQHSLRLAGQLTEARAPGDAAYVLENCLDRAPDSRVTHALVACFAEHARELSARGERAEVTVICRRWIMVAPDSPEPARLLAAEAAPEDGLEQLQSKLLEHPGQPDLYAEVERRVSSAPERVAFYRELVARRADAPELLLALAREYVATNQTQLAIVQLQKAVKLRKDPEVLRELASCYSRLGKKAMADKILASLK